MTQQARLIATVGVCVLALVAACDDGNASVLSGLTNDNDTTDRARSYDDVLEALPDPQRPAGRRMGTDRAEYVVVGEVADVAPGVCMSWDEDGAERFIHKFGAGEADRCTVHMQVGLTQVVAANAGVDRSPSGTIQVGLSVDPDVDVDSARRELTGLGTVVLVLKRSPIFVYDRRSIPDGQEPTDGVWGVLEGGSFIGRITDSGRIEWPAMSAETRDELLPSAGLTLDELVAAAQE